MACGAKASFGALFFLWARSYKRPTDIMNKGAFFPMGALSLSPNRGRLPAGKKEGTSNGAGAYNELYGIIIHLLCTLAEMAHRMK
ncbi:hypothetical protein BJQ97_02245 [Geobacillus sp. TFV-3]|nr:hypothetical protein BJQ97_02245 [Geobacillus sp. TFV-3]